MVNSQSKWQIDSVFKGKRRQFKDKHISSTAHFRYRCTGVWIRNEIIMSVVFYFWLIGDTFLKTINTLWTFYTEDDILPSWFSTIIRKQTHVERKSKYLYLNTNSYLIIKQYCKHNIGGICIIASAL